MKIKPLILFYVCFILCGTLFIRAETEGKSFKTSENARRFTWSQLEAESLIDDFVKIPSGEFLMGESKVIEFEKGHFNNSERPVRKILISHDFEIGRYEVTQKQWEAVMGDNPSYFEGEQLPVDHVNWGDIEEFTKKLNSISKKYNYRLPTEAEWEYAARAGTTGDYAGDLDKMAWYKSNSGNKTHPVGTKQANAWGLHDMYGNVSEWCFDRYGEYSTETLVDPVGALTGTVRVLRGCSWDDPANHCRSASRFAGASFGRSYLVGFRLVRENK